MSKHTPGPWRIAGSTYSERWIVDSESPKTGKQNLIAMLQDHWKGNANGYMDANASLIAAAPQMLEALEKIAAIGRQKGDARPQDAVSCFVIAETAIAAAKGEI